MVKKLAVVMYPGVADWEVGFPIFCLRPGLEHTFVSIGPKRIKTALGFDLEVNLALKDIGVSDFDGIYLPGGVDPEDGRFPRDLAKDATLIKIIQEFWKQRKIVGAICGAPLVLGAAGILMGSRFACDITEDTRGWFQGATRVEGPLAVDGNIVTASVQAIIPFSVELARLLGKDDIATSIQEFFAM
jgi:4-methyl-5(b-hydroxyethyl)-thiazole monophosphate biosynthesis